MSRHLARELTAEAVGTFFLMLGIALAVAEAPEGLAPIAIGTLLVALVYSCGHISKAQFNPAVSLAFYLRGTNSLRQLVSYVAVQVASSAAAAGVFLAMADRLPVPDLDPVHVALGEVLFTFLLVWVILNVASARGLAGNEVYGISIGFVVMASAFVIGPLSGAALNPAIAVGGVVGGVFEPADLWIYWIACPAGAVLAARVFGFATGQADEGPSAGDALVRGLDADARHEDGCQQGRRGGGEAGRPDAARQEQP